MAQLKADAAALPAWLPLPDPRKLAVVVGPNARPRCVFLSGATGFFGSFLLERLARDGNVDKVCVSVGGGSG